MPLDTLRIVAVLVHFAGSVLLAMAFINVSIVVFRFCMSKIKCVCFRGTRLPMFPTLIALGGSAFIFESLIFTYVSLVGVFEFASTMRFFAMAVLLLGSLSFLYGVSGFYAQAKIYLGGKNWTGKQ